MHLGLRAPRAMRVQSNLLNLRKLACALCRPHLAGWWLMIWNEVAIVRPRIPRPAGVAAVERPRRVDPSANVRRENVLARHSRRAVHPHVTGGNCVARHELPGVGSRPPSVAQ
jgi:hypothetical protein